jgi:hypothetical protein
LPTQDGAGLLQVTGNVAHSERRIEARRRGRDRGRLIGERDAIRDQPTGRHGIGEVAEPRLHERQGADGRQHQNEQREPTERACAARRDE